ncbi:polymorphic toxin type 50 domain-containing protein [Streptococcus timonensis]
MNDEIDVLPKLLQEVKKEFELSYRESEIIRNAFATLEAKKATYKTANEFAIEIGEILSKALGAYISADKLPNGKMYYNIAQRLLTDVLGRNHEIVSGYASDVQKNLNDKAKIGLKVQVPKLNQDRIAGIVNRFSSEENFEDVSWLLGEPIVNFTQSIIDDSIRKNAEFHAKTGMTPTISRHSTGRCCKWCDSLVGNYIYGEEPNNFYRRHQHCNCVIDYHPKNGKVQNSWTKKIRNESSNELEIRKQMNIDVRDNNRKADIQEYKKIVDVLGVQNAPISLAKFQDLKYNGGEGYERLKDVVYIQEKFKNGTWLDKINPEKQARHIQSTSLTGKSYFYDHVDVNALYDKYKMTGFLETSRNGDQTSNEKVDLFEDKPLGTDVYTGKQVNAMTIKYGKTGAHLIPTYYERGD